MKSRWLSVASAMAMSWCALLGFVFASLIVPVVLGRVPSRAAGFVYSLVPLVLAILSGIAGYGIRQRKKPYRVLAVLSAAINLLFLVAFPVRAGLVGIPLNAFLLLIVGLHWKRFDVV